MKKKVLYLILGLFLIIGLIYVGFSIGLFPLYKPATNNIDSRDLYSEGGKKVIEEFGTRRFVIFRDHKDKNEQIWNLYDRGSSTSDAKSIDPDIDNFKKISPYVYSIGRKGYTKLNYETAEIKQSMDVFEFLKEDQEIFDKLEYTKNTVNKSIKHNVIFECDNKKFAIVRSIQSSTVIWKIKDLQGNKEIDNNIYNFKEISNCVYVIGNRGYTKLNYKTAEIKQSMDISEFLKEDQEIFDKLEYTKDVVIIR